MRARACLILLVAFLVPACSGGERKLGAAVDPAPTTPPARVSPTPAPTERISLGVPPPAQMFAGTDAVEGAIQVFCRGERCERESRTKPRATLAAPESGFVAFTVHRAPREARLEVLPRGERSPQVHDLTPGTMMLFPVRLGTGRYQLALVASWADSEARWLFSLKVD